MLTPLTDEEFEKVARSVYTTDRFTPSDEVWCNFYWLRRFAKAIEEHHGIRAAAQAAKAHGEGR